ncbi:hypothetical protein V8E52_010911, partial [Russula decolorans]
MDTVPLVASIDKVLQEVVKGPIIIQDKISLDKLQKPRMRAQALIETPPTITVKVKEGQMMPLMDIEVHHCAAVIVAAFLNPISVNWDYDRFAESERKRCSSGKYFPKVHMGKIIKLTTVVDMHGKILVWYLPGLLLPQRVEEMNRVTECLKTPLCDSNKSEKGKGSSSWRLNGFTCDGKKSIFGAGKLSLSVGKFQMGRQRLQDHIYVSPELRKEPVRQWLQFIDPVEQLLNAVLQIVHPEMWLANSKATSLLLEQMNI